MCVAAIIKGASPPLDDLLDMEAENPHGAGMAWQVPGENTLSYKKGLSAAEVHEMLDGLPRPVLLHFRYATHGTKSKALSHPFPLGIRALLDPSLEGKTKACLIHNGVWGEYYKHYPDFLPASLDVSDTAVAAYVALRKPHILKGVQWATAVGRARGKNRRMSVKTTGTWQDYQGNAYSNMGWRGARATPRTRFAMSDFYDNWGDISSHYTPARPARESAKVFSEYHDRGRGQTWRKDPHTGSWYKVQPDAFERDQARLLGILEREEDMFKESTKDDFYMVPETEVMAVQAEMVTRRRSVHEAIQPLWDGARGRWMDDEDEAQMEGGGYSG